MPEEISRSPLPYTSKACARPLLAQRQPGFIRADLHVHPVPDHVWMAGLEDRLEVGVPIEGHPLRVVEVRPCIGLVVASVNQPPRIQTRWLSDTGCVKTLRPGNASARDQEQARQRKRDSIPL